MRNKLITLGLSLALSIVGPIWATPPADVATGGSTVTAADGARPLKAAPSRRLLGVWLLAMSGIVIVLRVRRRHSFLTSRPRDRKRVVAPASV